ncbi:hypothetical protein LUR56_13275 [Streptomyces sp. MT29]|nr:hypothetical protein [Streptomyces sp. MT29]
MSRPVQGGLTVTALVFVPLLAVAGSDSFRATLDFTTGVLSLVSLSAAVAWGLLATDRLFLSTRQRIICQGIHRATAIAALGFLLLHGTVKIALGHVSLIGALIPFGLGVTGTAGLIGFGSLAGLLMVVTAATGALRSAFAHPSPAATRLGQSLGSPREAGGIAGRWRALHALAYPAWCAALVHGLYAGRAPATWVVVMYSLCLTAVAGALCLRLLPRPTKRRITDRITALMSPDADLDLPDPVLRGSSRPGAERGPGRDREPPAADPEGGVPRTGRSGALRCARAPCRRRCPRRCPHPYRCPARCTRRRRNCCTGSSPRRTNRRPAAPTGSPTARWADRGPGRGWRRREVRGWGRRAGPGSERRAAGDIGRIPRRLPGR